MDDARRAMLRSPRAAPQAARARARPGARPIRPLAIELAFDAESDQRLASVWERLSRLYGGPTRSELGVRPHVTLALFRRSEPGDVTGVVDALAYDLRPFSLSLTAVDRFPGPEGVVFLRPAADSDPLRRAHALLHAALGADRERIDAYYRPGAWRPHCTMALDVPRVLIRSVLSACRSSEGPGEVRVSQVQIVRYRPATEVAWSRLRGAS